MKDGGVILGGSCPTYTLSRIIPLDNSGSEVFLLPGTALPIGLKWAVEIDGERLEGSYDSPEDAHKTEYAEIFRRAGAVYEGTRS